MLERKYDASYKLIVVGDSGVGKTSILASYMNASFTDATQPTLGVEFFSKVLKKGDKNIQLMLWDTAGQDIFRSVTRSYYRGSHGALLVFDLTKKDSFSNLGSWLHDIRESAGKNVVVLLLGNKLDLCEDDITMRAVTSEEAMEYAASNDMEYIEGSAKEKIRIEEAFDTCIEQILAKVKEGVFPNQSAGVRPDEKREDSGKGKCC